MEEDFEHTVKLARALLNFEFFWPDEKGEFKLYAMVMVLCEAGLVVIIGTYDLTFYQDNFSEFIGKMFPLLAFFLAFCKMLNFTVNRKQHAHILKTLKCDFWSGDEVESKLIKNTSKTTRFLFFILMSIVYETTFAFISTPMLENIFTNREKHPNFRRRLPFDFFIVNLVYIDQSKSPYYEIFYVIQVLVILHCVMNMGVFDNVYAIYVLHVCAQAQIIQRRLKCITNHKEEKRYRVFCKQYGIEDYIEEDNDNLRVEGENIFRHLNKCIEHHQLLLDTATKLESIYHLELLVQFFVSTVCICTSLFHLASEKASYVSRYFALTFVASALLQLFEYSYIGDKLTTEFQELGTACYSCKWYHCNTKIKKSLLFVLARTQRPVFLTIGKMGIVGVDRFAAVVRTGASYFTILKSFENQ